MIGMLFDIQKFCLHDGPGIRTTVFFKGCPLSCSWCHNPEGISSSHDLWVSDDRCIGCRACITVCPHDAITVTDRVCIDRDKCSVCRLCAQQCYSNALDIAGYEISADELLMEIKKDKVFYDQSGGGVTFSGGEPLLQIEFLAQVLSLCKRENVLTAVDSSGFVPWHCFDRIIELVDVFLFDVKLINDIEHRHHTGVSNDQIISNLKQLTDQHPCVNVTVPIIPTITDHRSNIDGIGKLCSELNISSISLVPYHNTGIGKFERLSRPYNLTSIKPPDDAKMNEIRSHLRKYGLTITDRGAKP